MTPRASTARPALGWASPIHLAYAACLAPLLVFTIRVLASGWAPQGDAAVIGLKSLAVLDGNLPLLGQWTTGAAVEGHAPPHHPGPLYYYLLAPVLALTAGSPGGLALAASTVVAGCLALTVRSARWVAGDRVALGVGIALGVLVLVLGVQVAAPWNPWPAAFGLPAAALLTVCLLRQEWRALPWWVLTVALVAQSHAGSAIPAAALCVPVAWALVKSLAGNRLFSVRGVIHRVPVRLLGGSAALAVVVWLPVLVELARNDPNNIEALRSYASAGEVRRFGAVGALAATTTLLGPGPIDVLAGLLGGRGYTSWLESGPGPLLLAVAATRPAGLVLLGGCYLLARHLRRVGFTFRGWEHGRVVALLPALLAALAGIASLARADTPEGAVVDRGFYSRLAAPVLWVLAVLVVYAALPLLRRRWPSRMARWERRRRSPLATRLPVAAAAALAGLALVVPMWRDEGVHARELAAAVEKAASGHDEVEIILTGQGGALPLSAAAYAVRSSGQHYYLSAGDFLDTDFAAYRADRAPQGTPRIALVGTNGSAEAAPPPGNWTKVATVRREQIFSTPAGATTVFRDR